jgi:hypothetical protein
MATVTAAHTKHPVAALSGVPVQLGWFAAVAALAFAVPYVLTSAWNVNTDLYYLCYFAVALAAISAYVVVNDVDLVKMFTQTWKLSVVLGFAAAAFVVWNVLANEEATPRPGGAYFAFEFAWRGMAYGVVDALLLSAFPAAVAFKLMHGDIAVMSRRAAFAGIALILTLIITATYHLGYEQFRDDGVRKPEIGNVVISIPTLASGNPIGSVLAHASMHGAAVTHAYETETFLPPQKSAD